MVYFTIGKRKLKHEVSAPNKGNATSQVYAKFDNPNILEVKLLNTEQDTFNWLMKTMGIKK